MGKASVNVTVSPGATSYNVTFAPSTLGPTTFSGSCFFAASRAATSSTRDGAAATDCFALRVDFPEKSASAADWPDDATPEEIALRVDGSTDAEVCGLCVVVALVPPFLNTTRLPTATTSTAATARHPARLYHLTECARGTTPRGT